MEQKDIPSTFGRGKNLLMNAVNLQIWVRVTTLRLRIALRLSAMTFFHTPLIVPLTNDTQSFVRQSVRNDGKEVFPRPIGERARVRGNDSAIAEQVHNDGKQQTVKNLVPYSPITLLPSKKAAFTLAEVLITLGIIGVVAALTMPNLIANYQKKVWTTQFKKNGKYHTKSNKNG